MPLNLVQQIEQISAWNTIKKVNKPLALLEAKTVAIYPLPHGVPFDVVYRNGKLHYLSVGRPLSWAATDCLKPLLLSNTSIKPWAVSKIVIYQHFFGVVTVAARRIKPDYDVATYIHNMVEEDLAGKPQPHLRCICRDYRVYFAHLNKWADDNFVDRIYSVHNNYYHSVFQLGRKAYDMAVVDHNKITSRHKQYKIVNYSHLNGGNKFGTLNVARDDIAKTISDMRNLINICYLWPIRGFVIVSNDKNYFVK